MSEFRNPFLKKIRSKNKKTENQCQNAACEQKKPSPEVKFGSNKSYIPRTIYEPIGKAILKNMRSKKSNKRE